jgi:hypothetical protein
MTMTRIHKVAAALAALLACLTVGLAAPAQAHPKHLGAPVGAASTRQVNVFCYSPNGDRRVEWQVTWEASNFNVDQIRVYKMRAIFADHNPIVGWVVSDVPSATFNVDYNSVVLLTQNFGTAAVDTWLPASGFSSRTGYRIVARVTTGGTSTANTVQCGQSDDFYFPL